MLQCRKTHWRMSVPRRHASRAVAAGIGDAGQPSPLCLRARRQTLWRARCGESRTPGSASGLGKRTSSNAGTAPQADSTLWTRGPADVFDHPLLQGGLQHLLGQQLQQAVRAGQVLTPGASRPHQPTHRGTLRTALTSPRTAARCEPPDVPVVFAAFGIELMLESVSVIADQPSSPASLACRASYTGIRTVPSGLPVDGSVSQPGPVMPCGLLGRTHPTGKPDAESRGGHASCRSDQSENGPSHGGWRPRSGGGVEGDVVAECFDLADVAAAIGGVLTWRS